MKSLSYLLTFFVLFLAVQPTFALVTERSVTDCCGSSCCSDDENSPKDTKQNKDDCKDQNCNPFQACGCCIGFTVKQGFYTIEPTHIQKQNIIIFEENSVSQFSPDVWQPPKIS